MQASLFDLQPPTLSVGDVTRHIRQLLDLDDILQDLWIEGEISNWSQAASGHIYFTLKDAQASIRCVIWRSSAQRLRYRPQGTGEAVLAHGRVSVYEAGGNYQFYIDALEPAGLGALYAQFERLKSQLAEEGLFDEEHKAPLPPVVSRIGVITSPNAAALQDVINVLSRRYPLAEVVISPTPVQGQDAPPKIVDAVTRLAVLSPSVDVILLVRGGGSLEDLWAFNDERLARTLAACSIPIVSGVGHETDFTIADFVADYRAPTPSAAAELVTRDVEDLKQQLVATEVYLVNSATEMLEAAYVSLQAIQQRLQQQSPQRQVDNRRQQIDDHIASLGRAFDHKLQMHQTRLAGLDARLQTLNPKATLARGYAIIRKGDNLVAQARALTSGDRVSLVFQDGEVEAEIQRDEH